MREVKKESLLVALSATELNILEAKVWAVHYDPYKVNLKYLDGRQFTMMQFLEMSRGLTLVLEDQGWLSENLETDPTGDTLTYRWNHEQGRRRKMK